MSAATIWNTCARFRGLAAVLALGLATSLLGGGGGVGSVLAADGCPEPNDTAEQAVQSGGRLQARDIGRVYEAIFERENSEKVRRHGPMYLLNRVHVAESVDRAQTVFDAWAVSDHIPEADDRRAYGSLGDQPVPPFGNIVYATGACTKCDDENPLRSYRVVARFDTVVHVLYTWGRDSSSNFDVVMFLANKLPRRLGLDGAPTLPGHFFQRLPSTVIAS